ncbi:MAG: hypothetical protein LRY55_01765 [Leadbetterella sp.]|nr:hypothetical protein [Leadbetterella sp.]
MNKALASFVFTGETLFNRKDDAPAKEEAGPPLAPAKKNTGQKHADPG